MRAEMNEKGVITISPETPLEAYALKKWVAESIRPDAPTLASTMQTYNMISTEKLLISTELKDEKTTD